MSLPSPSPSPTLPPRSLSYSVKDVYNVVADVDNYKHFLPWCKHAAYTKFSPPRSIVRLVIGFPPLTESYTALVLSKPYHSIRVRAG